jgi:hypothetical protein
MGASRRIELDAGFILSHRPAIRPVLLLVAFATFACGASETPRPGETAGTDEDGCVVEGSWHPRLATGSEFGCAIRGDGTIVCWGAPTLSPEAVMPPTNGRFVGITAEGWEACAVDEDGSVACWSGDSAKLVPTSKMVQVDVNAGGCGIDSCGLTTCWPMRNSLVPPPSDRRFSHVAAAALASCGVQKNGEVFCWGSNMFGLLDHPTGAFKTINMAGRSACAIGMDDRLTCWGAGNPSDPVDRGLEWQWGQADPAGRDGTAARLRGPNRWDARMLGPQRRRPGVAADRHVCRSGFRVHAFVCPIR